MSIIPDLSNRNISSPGIFPSGIIPSALPMTNGLSLGMLTDNFPSPYITIKSEGKTDDNKAFMKSMIYLSLVKDYTADVSADSGKIQLRITNPDFVKANRGIMMFSNSLDSSHKTNMQVFGEFSDYLHDAKKKENFA